MHTDNYKRVDLLIIEGLHPTTSCIYIELMRYRKAHCSTSVPHCLTLAVCFFSSARQSSMACECDNVITEQHLHCSTAPTKWVLIVTLIWQTEGVSGDVCWGLVSHVHSRQNQGMGEGLSVYFAWPTLQGGWAL